jgi:3-deoxy-D-arabino-heptulosonate 7-phosphate (DAHP) synthase
MTNAKTPAQKRTPQTAKPTRAAVAAKKPVAKKTAAKTAAPAAGKSASPKTPAATTAASVAKTKHKLVRDSFTIPKAEYAMLQGLKARALSLKHAAKKSELLRAGVNALNAMGDKDFLAALNAVPSLKTGRPKGGA